MKALFERIAVLREQEVELIRDLAEVLGNQLDEFAEQSVYAAMRTATQSATEPERLLRVKDLAELLGVAETTVRRMRKRGDLPPAIDLGGVWRWRRSTIETWIAEREGGPL